TSQISTPSLHDALPICARGLPVSGSTPAADLLRRATQLSDHSSPPAPAASGPSLALPRAPRIPPGALDAAKPAPDTNLRVPSGRSEEHTSELQSPCNLV